MAYEQLVVVDKNYIRHPIESSPIFGGGGGSGAVNNGESNVGGTGGGAVCLQFCRIVAAANITVSANGCAGSNTGSGTAFGNGGGGGGGFARLLYRIKDGAGTLAATANGGSGDVGGDGIIAEDGMPGIAILEVV